MWILHLSQLHDRVLQLLHGYILTCLILVLFCFQKKSKYVSIARGGYQGMLLFSTLGHGLTWPVHGRVWLLFGMDA